MQLNSSLFVLSILVGSGLVGGFCVSKGSGHYLGLLPTHTAHRHGGRNYGAEGAAGIMAAGGGGSNEQVKMAGGGGGGDEGAEEAGGAGGGEGGGGVDAGGADGEGMTRTIGAGEAAGGAGAGDDAAGGAADADAAEAARAKAFAAASVSASNGAEAASVLAGNTLKRTYPDGSPHYTYFAARGWQADGDGHRFLVRAWDRSANRFCEPEPKSGKMFCTPLEVRFGSTGDQPDGAMIGVLRTGGNAWAFVIKGNAARFPDHIPSLDSAVEARASAGAGTRPTASGKAAWSAMLGHTLGTAPNAASRQVLAFEPDGRLLQIAAHGEAAATAAGVHITLGHWSFDKGLVCEADSAAATTRTCYRPEAYGSTSFRLVPQAAGGAAPGGAAQRLSLLVEQNIAFKATQD